MSIYKLNNMLNMLGLGRKVEKTKETPYSSPLQAKSKIVPEVNQRSSEEDSVAISFEGVIKEAIMKVTEDLSVVREEKVAELKERISSGRYHVSPEDVARAIIKGRTGIDEEKK